ncbi:hypothetical protein JQX13_35300 [Archangium violaceum]|uniref:hypothetical protein n=1 Tax=Archangium violaceum TaxID=83451 RepID=UPI00193C0488|nr:hypothetical protein [Archangium violaceum]QRK05413.1 hypothetical protein JQX13_35300 [Archangium violaceum]
MRYSSAARTSSPLPLRVLHGVVFGGFSALCLAADWPELEHLVRTQLQPFHAGPPPRPELLWAVLAAVVGMLVVLVQAVRGRSARLQWSLLILGALVISLWGNREGLVAGRTADSANLKILQVARELHGRTVDALQERGSAPEDVGSWQAALQEVSHGLPTPVRSRSFAPLPFVIQKVDSPDALPEDVPPGTLLLYVMQGGVAYEIHPVGLSPSGEPWRLREPGGEPLVFRGAFNPDLIPSARDSR